MDDWSQERHCAMTWDRASGSRRRLLVAGVEVSERSGDAAALARMAADSLQAHTLLAHVHPHRELGSLLPPGGDEQLVGDGAETRPRGSRGLSEGRTPALRLLAGGSTP